MSKQTVMLGVALAALPPLAMAQESANGQLVEVSTTTQKSLKDLDTASKNGKRGLDALFDQSRGGRGDAAAVAANRSGLKAFQFGAPVKAGAKTAAVPPPAPKDASAKPQHDLDGLQQVSPDGVLYRLRPSDGRAWYNLWRFWDNTKYVEKAAPDSNGDTYNSKGEFVGNWKKVLTVDADRLEVAQSKDGQDHVYTFKGRGWDQEVSRDGKYLTTFGNDAGLSANLAEVHAGADGKVYARYAANSQDVIVTNDASTQKQKVVARVPAEVKVWQEYHPGYTEHYTDSNGDEHYVDHPGYWQEHVDRNGVTQFQVTQDGRVLDLYKGNVFEDKADGTRRPILATTNGQTLGDVPWGEVQDFKVDSRGNLYTQSGGTGKINGGGSFDLSGQQLRVDDAGNMYRVDGLFHPVLRQVNVLADPANAGPLAAPASDGGQSVS